MNDDQVKHTPAEQPPDGAGSVPELERLGQLIDSERNYQALLNAMADGVFIASDHRFVFCNRAMTELLGVDQAGFVGQPFSRFVAPEFLQLWSQRFRLRISGATDVPGRYELRMINQRDREEFWVELIATPIDFSGTRSVLGIIRDIRERKTAEHLIWAQAHLDFVTRLPNRFLLNKRLDEALTETRRSGEPLALFFLDLDEFKQINDIRGHRHGDLVLTEIAARLQRCVRESDTLARFGGDEFNLLCPGLQSEASLLETGERLLAAINQPILVDSEMVQVRASIGIARFPEDADTAEDLLRHADQAMYEAKRSGSNKICLFRQELDAANRRKGAMASGLDHALRHGELYFLYQPIVHLPTMRIEKAEALIRWRTADGRIIGPAEFIPVAEETGRIVEIGNQMLDVALGFARDCRQQLSPAFQIAVNISAMQLSDTDSQLERKLLDNCTELQTNAPICIELTESMFVDTRPHVQQRLRLLREAGFDIAIDDFGTGYSALSYLRKLDVDYIKIDRSFIRHLALDRKDLNIFRAIVMLAHEIGALVIAEGIESEQQLNLVQEAGCDYAQGYYFARPLADQDLLKLVSGFNG